MLGERMSGEKVSPGPQKRKRPGFSAPGVLVTKLFGPAMQLGSAPEPAWPIPQSLYANSKPFASSLNRGRFMVRHTCLPATSKSEAAPQLQLLNPLNRVD